MLCSPGYPSPGYPQTCSSSPVSTFCMVVLKSWLHCPALLSAAFTSLFASWSDWEARLPWATAPPTLQCEHHIQSTLGPRKLPHTKNHRNSGQHALITPSADMVAGSSGHLAQISSAHRHDPLYCWASPVNHKFNTQITATPQYPWRRFYRVTCNL